MTQIEKLKEITQKLVLFFTIYIVILENFNLNMGTNLNF